MFIPIHDANRLVYIKRQWVTLSFIALNVLVYIFVNLLPAQEDDTSLLFVSYGFAPLYIFDGLPASSPFLQIPEGMSFLSYAFMHGDFMHLLGNMAFLWVFGDNVEDAMGHWRFVLFYILCCVASAFAHGLYFINDPAPLIGASGAVSGIVAAYLILHPKVWIWSLVLMRLPIMLPAWFLLGGWTLIQILEVFARSESNVSFICHVGGLLAGAILIVFLKRKQVPLFDRQVTTPQAAQLSENETANRRIPSALDVLSNTKK